jgi:hypothetical protein
MTNAKTRTIIRHIEGLRFVVTYADGTVSALVTLDAPTNVAGPDRPDSNLLADLRWYLEDVPNLSDADPSEAAGFIVALSAWARSTFDALFVDAAGRDRLSMDTAKDSLPLIVSSADPTVLFWPWEILLPADGPPVGLVSRMERRFENQRGLKPLPLPAGLPADKLNVLLVIPRPLGEDDVGYHAVSRPLVDLLSEGNYPVDVDVLRPPLLASLEERLRSKPGYYHVVHFDGHGSYNEDTGESLLLFEDMECKKHSVAAAEFAALLAKYQLPVVVLNACRSAHVGSEVDDPFASTAAALVRAGIRNVVAMSYHLLVTSARHFVNGFYEQLALTGDVAEAARAGRREMFRNPERIGLDKEIDLQDWLNPVVYGHDVPPLDVSTMKGLRPRNAVLDEKYLIRQREAFLGREGDIQRLERMLLSGPAAGIVAHGLIGIGKTTFAKGFLNWFLLTGFSFSRNDVDSKYGPFQDLFWIDFETMHNGLDVIYIPAEKLLPEDKQNLPLPQLIQELGLFLMETPVLFVWDRFECAMGVPESGLAPKLQDRDRESFQMFLEFLQNTPSKVLILSRSPERWLGDDVVMRLPLAGLGRRESREHCVAASKALGFDIDWSDGNLVDALNAMNGHPQTLREVLAARKDIRLEPGEDTTPFGDIIPLIRDGLPEELTPALQSLGLHREFVHLRRFITQGTCRYASFSEEMCCRCFHALECAGLLHETEQDLYQMHPFLSDALEEHRPATVNFKRALVEYATQFAQHVSDREFKSTRDWPLNFYGSTFEHAQELAEQLKMDDEYERLTAFLQQVYDQIHR